MALSRPRLSDGLPRDRSDRPARRLAVARAATSSGVVSAQVRHASDEFPRRYTRDDAVAVRQVCTGAALGASRRAGCFAATRSGDVVLGAGRAADITLGLPRVPLLSRHRLSPLPLVTHFAPPSPFARPRAMSLTTGSLPNLNVPPKTLQLERHASMTTYPPASSAPQQQEDEALALRGGGECCRCVSPLDSEWLSRAETGFD